VMPPSPNAVVDPERLDETRCGMSDRGDAGSGSLERHAPPSLSDTRHEQDAGAGPHGPHVSNRPADNLDVGASADHLPPPSAGDGEEAAVRFSSGDRKSTRLNSSHVKISYAVFCLKKKKERCDTEAV